MKRFLALGLFGLAGVIFSGCPIYSDSTCNSSQDCSAGYCGRDGMCHDGSGQAGSGGSYYGLPCSRPADCGPTETCAADGYCRPGDCMFPGTGCVSGFTCDKESHACVAIDADGGAGDGAAGAAGADGGGGSGGDDASATDGSAGADAAASDAPQGAVWCGAPSDCAASETCGADGQCHAGDCGTTACINGFVCTASSGGLACVHGNPAACGNDVECTAAGSLCADGMCTAPADLCSDQTQCPGTDLCVNGKCVARCTTDAQCTDGFGCHPTLGVCIVAAGNGTGCQKTSDCAGGGTDVCIGNVCVPRCGAGGSCAAGSVCVDNGCVPEQKIKVGCAVDGAQDSCAAGSVCLHHNCYVSCDTPNESACASQPVFTVCKAVTTASGTHGVCGSAQNLGPDCDPTAGKACAPGKTCIDGFCRQ